MGIGTMKMTITMLMIYDDKMDTNIDELLLYR